MVTVAPTAWSPLHRDIGSGVPRQAGEPVERAAPPGAALGPGATAARRRQASLIRAIRTAATESRSTAPTGPGANSATRMTATLTPNTTARLARARRYRKASTPG